ncbi:MAG TPA: alkaline phosphatase PhoX [Gemmataceae bacterium]|nr:alkaline phosphatase PhoX [Gemmataceae bacterium]
MRTRLFLTLAGAWIGTPAFAQLIGPSTTTAPYLVPSDTRVATTSLWTAGNTAGGYKMVGKPDGLGAFDNGNGTFTVLMNHELATSEGVTRAHGSAGAFVSRLVIDRATRAVVSGGDLVQNVHTWNTGSSSYNAAGTTTFGKFCSADLPLTSAFFDPASGAGTSARIFLNGEENGTEGRAFGHIVTGANAGKSYELPHLGKFNWENAIACPRPQVKTVVMGNDDTTGGQVYMYVGNKQTTGTDVERAGLVGGNLYGVRVTGMTTEPTGAAPTSQAFTMHNLGNVANTTGATLQTNSAANAVTGFQRPEDGAWDPNNPNDYYFVTTTTSRLWRMRFTDITNPTAGGTLTQLLTGSEGQVNFDNVTVTTTGKVVIQEDPGSNIRRAKVWEYDIGSGALTELAQASTVFVTGQPGFLTTSEESSGVIDITDLMTGTPGVGERFYLSTFQAHFPTGDAETVEGGQLLLVHVQPVPEPGLVLAVAALGLGVLRTRRRDDRVTRRRVQ